MKKKKKKKKGFQILWSIECFYLSVTRYSFSICQILSVSMFKPLRHLTKATVAILQLITCSVTVFGVKKEISSGIKLITMWEKKGNSLGHRCTNITDSNPSAPRLPLSYKWTFCLLVPVMVYVCFSRSTFNPPFISCSNGVIL